MEQRGRGGRTQKGSYVDTLYVYGGVKPNPREKFVCELTSQIFAPLNRQQKANSEPNVRVCVCVCGGVCGGVFA